MAPNFSLSERDIINKFQPGATFLFDGSEYIVISSSKPRPSKGECKTDVFLQTVSVVEGTPKEFKISIKLSNADFLENKMSLDRAVEIFGINAQEVITKSLLKIKDKFEKDYLIHFRKGHRTEEKTIRIGWKFELVNKPSGQFVSDIELTDDQLLDVYSGTNLNESKRNCRVNGVIIENSGVADYILEVDNKREMTLQECIDEMVPLSEFVAGKKTYFACKAVNYRSIPDKWDGPRPLSAWIDWKLDEDNKLSSEIKYDKPLSNNANSVGDNIRKILHKLGIKSTNFDDLKIHLKNTVIKY